MKTLRWKRTRSTAKPLAYDGACLPVYACLGGPLEVGGNSGQPRVRVPTGIQIALDEGYEAVLRSNPKMAFEWGVALVGGMQTVAYGENGEIYLVLRCESEAGYALRHGDCVAYMTIAPVIRPELKELGR